LALKTYFGVLMKVVASIEKYIIVNFETHLMDRLAFHPNFIFCITKNNYQNHNLNSFFKVKLAL